jgi:hypothetical protein
MARPRKNNADYFSHDNNMRKDTKIESVRSKFGNEGYAVWCMLLETLTENENFRLRLSNAIDWELLAGDFRVDFERLKEMFDYFSRIELVEWDGVYVVCRNLGKRLSPLIEKREAFREKYAVSDAEMPVSTTETEVSDAEMPHSKVNKSKVKESKLNTLVRATPKRREDIDILLNGINNIVGVIDGSKQEQRNFAKNFLDSKTPEILRRAGNLSPDSKQVINATLRIFQLATKDNFHRKNCNSIKYVYNKAAAIALSGKTNQPKVAIITNE